MKRITFEEFVEQYKPIENHLDKNASYDGLMFETYGEELKHVKNQEDYKIWTLVNCDDELDFIIPGFNFVNRIGYFITEMGWNEENIEVDMNETTHVNKAKYVALEFLEENNLLTQEIEDKLHDYWSNKF